MTAIAPSVVAAGSSVRHACSKPGDVRARRRRARVARPHEPAALSMESKHPKARQLCRARAESLALDVGSAMSASRMCTAQPSKPMAIAAVPTSRSAPRP